MTPEFPLVSVICVSNRPHFIPGMLIMFQAQTWPNKELILVDASPGGACVAIASNQQGWREGLNGAMPGNGRSGLQALRVAPGTFVAVMRNGGLAEASRPGGGHYHTWMDDDGWHDPRRIETLVNRLEDPEDPCDVAGVASCYWTTPAKDMYHYRGTDGFPLSGSLLWRGWISREFRFNGGMRRAADTPWINRLRADKGIRMRIVDAELTVADTHGLNISNSKVPSLARPVSHVTAETFFGGEEFGLSRHLDRVKVAAERTRETCT